VQCLGTPPLRATLFVRIAKMAAGGSGVSTAVLDGLVALLNAGVHPSVPSIGSIGAADLALSAHLALPLMGVGEAEYQGEVMPASQALDRAGLRVLDLGPKDGIALMNSNAFSVGAGALAVSDAGAALEALEISAALSFEGFRANPGTLDPRVQMAAARLCALLAGSALWQSDGPRHVQDPLSFRCVARSTARCSPASITRGIPSRSRSTAAVTMRSSSPTAARCCRPAISTSPH
jgi:histidine ammonia-lyase